MHFHQSTHRYQTVNVPVHTHAQEKKKKVNFAARRHRVKNIYCHKNDKTISRRQTDTCVINKVWVDVFVKKKKQRNVTLLRYITINVFRFHYYKK